MPTRATKATVPDRTIGSAGNKVRLAVVGCGANAAINHLPAIARSTRVDPTVLVDIVPSRAEHLARQYNVAAIRSDFRGIEELADAAIVALPNDLHAPVSIELLNRGIHVLVEKPMALTAPDCDAMNCAAARAGRRLAVGLEFRFFSDSQFIKRLLTEALLGPISHFDMRMGIISDWPLESSYLFDKEKAGGGVLMDLGIHVIDLLLWWFGDCAAIHYADDACGGVESNCEMQLEFSGGTCGTVELSRTRNLRNSCIFDGERGRLTFETWSENPQFRLEFNGHDSYLAGHLGGPSFVCDCESAIGKEIEDFAAAIEEDREPFVNGVEGRRAIEFVERCYGDRRPLRFPWSL